jgi:hypothetical protein
MAATYEETNYGFAWSTVEAGHFKIFTIVSAFITIFCVGMKPVGMSTEKLESSRV